MAIDMSSSYVRDSSYDAGWRPIGGNQNTLPNSLRGAYQEFVNNGLSCNTFDINGNGVADTSTLSYMIQNLCKRENQTNLPKYVNVQDTEVPVAKKVELVSNTIAPIINVEK